jgi:hypothetical protein
MEELSGIPEANANSRVALNGTPEVITSSLGELYH